VYGNQESAIIEEILTKANEKLSRGIKVIVVDSAPEYYGRNLVKRLSSKGLQCQYTMLSMVNFLINTVTKVLIASTYILCNGALVAPMGTSMIGCIAS
jgi:translation initiation factor eIF-2B subunit delta